MQNMKPGTLIKDAYQAASDHVKKNYPELSAIFPKTLGFGIGSEFKEGLTINEKSEI